MAPGYAAAEESETSVTRAECVLEHTGQPSVTVLLRFLQVQRRTGAGGGEWDEAVEREVEVTADAAALSGAGLVHSFNVEGGEDHQDGVVRRREPLAGAITVRTVAVPGPWRAVRLQVFIENRTEAGSVPRRREDALHVAAATCMSADYLVSWNHRHMTRPMKRLQRGMAKTLAAGARIAATMLRRSASLIRSSASMHSTQSCNAWVTA